MNSSHECQLAPLLQQQPAAYHGDRAAAVAQYITETRDLVNTTILNTCLELVHSLIDLCLVPGLVAIVPSVCAHADDTSGSQL